MHPTPTEQLQVVQRLIEQAQSTTERSEDQGRLLADAASLLRRLERSWPRRMPFLLDDNELGLRLLSDLRPQLRSLVSEIDAAADRSPPQNEDQAHDLNLMVQGLLARAVNLLPADEAGDVGRRQIADHLRLRLAADPARNRDPVPRFERAE